MKLQYLIITTVLQALALSSAQSIRGASGEGKNRRFLTWGSSAFGCKGDTLNVGEDIHSGESICAEIGEGSDKEWTYFGIREYDMPDDPGYTLYQSEIWSENGTHDRKFRGIGTQGDAPFIRHQGDGHVVISNGSLSGTCRSRPDKRGPDGKLVIGGPLPDLLKLFDNDSDLTWKLSYKTLSSGGTYIGGSECYPEIDAKCVSVLTERDRLTWDEYVCEFDSDGSVDTRFGLDPHGVIGLWRYDEQVWRPDPGDGAKADWLHLQVDGHLTAYKGTEPNLTYMWQTNCFGDDTKITVADGDVHEFDNTGAAIWALFGSDSPQPVCLPRC